MEPIKLQNPSYAQLTQDRIVSKVLKLGHTVLGEYVYKTLVNGDRASEIDIVVFGGTYTYGTFNGNSESVDKLNDYLKEKFDCKCFDGGYLGYDDTYSAHLICPGVNDEQKNTVTVNIYDDISWTSLSPYDGLRYKKVNNRNLIVNNDGNEETCKKIVADMRKRRFTSWGHMNSADKKYFNWWTWTDTNSLSYKIKQHFGFEE